MAEPLQPARRKASDPLDIEAQLRERHRAPPDFSVDCRHAAVARALFGQNPEVVIAGKRFAIRRRLGAGAMGIVYDVEQAGCAGSQALKVLHRGDTDHAYWLKREFRTLVKIGHPNLIVLGDLFVDTTGAAFTMELVQGQDLLGHIRAHRGARGEHVRRCFAQLAEALLYLHDEGVIHRDLKPSNVLVQPDGRVVLLDFGLALSGLEREIAGTDGFMAPEQRAGCTVPASDLFALGVLLGLALEPAAIADDAARPRTPYGVETPNGTPSCELHELARRLKQDDPGQRPTALEVVRQLRRIPGSPRSVKHSLPFVGRTDELARIEAFAAKCRETPALVCVEAHSGLGKSALLQELARRLAVRGADTLVVSGRCCRREVVRYRALDPLVDALSEVLRRAPSDLVDGLGESVNAALLQQFPVLERVPSFAIAGRGVPLPADARACHVAAVGALRALLCALGRRRRLVLCLDDAHWLDIESLELITQLLQADESPPLLWVLAARPHASGECERLLRALPTSRRLALKLPPLAPDPARRLAEALLPGRDALWARAVALAGGNPFMLLQLGDAAFDPADTHEWQLERLLDRRIEALPAPARSLLQVIALSAQPIAPALLAEATNVRGAEIDGALRLLEAQRYVRPAAGTRYEVEPYHDRIAEHVTRALETDLSCSLHHRLALAFERADAASHARALAFHYRRAGEPARALVFAELAARKAASQLSFHEAAELLHECRQLAPDEARRRRFAQAEADALVNAGRDREAAEILADLAQLEPALRKRFKLACAAASLFFQGGYGTQAMRVLQPFLYELGLVPRGSRAGELASILYHRARATRVLRRLLPLQPTGDAFTLHARTKLCLLVASGFGRSDLLRGFDYASRAMVHAQHSRSNTQRAGALVLEALVITNLSPASPRPDALLAKARALLGPHQNAVLGARWHAAAAQRAGLRLDRRNMGQHAQHAVRLFTQRARGVQMELGEARLMSAIARFAAGEEVSGEVSDLVTDAVRRGDRGSELRARLFHAVTRLRCHQLDQARAELARLHVLSTEERRHGIHFIAQAAEARVELYEGRSTVARSRLTQNLQRMTWQGFILSPWMRTELRYLLALASIQASGRRARAAVRLARHLARDVLPAARLLGEQLGCWLQATRGDVGSAVTQLHHNARALENDGSSWYAWGSRLLAHTLAGEDDEVSSVLSAVHAHGVPRPRAFLSAYCPLAAPDEVGT